MMLQSRASCVGFCYSFQWLFSHFSGLRQSSTEGIVVWGNAFEMRVCTFGIFLLSW